jgi:hypothetical protein
LTVPIEYVFTTEVGFVYSTIGPPLDFDAVARTVPELIELSALTESEENSYLLFYLWRIKESNCLKRKDGLCKMLSQDHMFVIRNLKTSLKILLLKHRKRTVLMNKTDNGKTNV